MLAAQKLNTGSCVSSSGQDPKRVLPTVGFPALQFNTPKKQFVATCKLPAAVIHQKTELTFNFQSLMWKRSSEYQA
jgi:hypothetical protein